MTSQAIDTSTQLKDYISDLGQKARAASNQLRLAEPDEKSKALIYMANEIRMASGQILEANARDMSAAKAKGLSGALCDRLALTPQRIDAIAGSLEAIAALPDPVGAIDETWTQSNGLKFSKIRVPIGVIGMIYESRPNVTADAGALCLKSGNACILRGGSESRASNQAIHKALITGLKTTNIPADSIQLISTTDRAAVGHLLSGLNNTVDLIIPRGGKSLIQRVQSEARIPVLAHLEGLCHSYVHRAANLEMAYQIILNAKMRRTGVCGSTETVLIDRDISAEFLPRLASELSALGCELRGDKKSQDLHANIIPASQADYATEHLAPILNIRIVDDIDMALAHIETYGSGHTDSIITEDTDKAERFLRNVDSAICMHNSSTQFADGGEFGFGAEIGIATGRLHARGPVGAKHLTTYKYTVEGNGQVRP